MLTVAAVAECFGVTQATVLAWIHAGELKAVNVSRSPGAKRPRWRVTQAALAAFETARRTTPAASRACRRRPSGDVIEFYKA